MTFTFGSVCSGIEAASVAWEPLGARPLWFAEVDSFASAVLAHHWPAVSNLGDMTRLADLVRRGAIPAPAVLVGGTPCQSFSVAGARRGLEDPRGALSLAWVDLLDAICHARMLEGKAPALGVWENVPGVLDDRGNAFGEFIGLLVGAGAAIRPPGARWPGAGVVSGPRRAVCWRVLDAQHFGVPQRRRRVFLVAGDGVERVAQILIEREGMRGGAEAGGRIGRPAPHGPAGLARAGGVSRTLTAGYPRTDGLTETFVPVAFDGVRNSFGAASGVAPPLRAQDCMAVLAPPAEAPGVRRFTPRECERLQGFPDDHTAVPYRGRPAADGPRYKAIGNSMAVPVMSWIGARIAL